MATNIEKKLSGLHSQLSWLKFKASCGVIVQNPESVFLQSIFPKSHFSEIALPFFRKPISQMPSSKSISGITKNLKTPSGKQIYFYWKNFFRENVQEQRNLKFISSTFQLFHA